MRVFFTTLLAFFLALLAGGLVAQQMAVMTDAGEEYILVFVAVPLLAVVLAIVFLPAQFGNYRPLVDATAKWSLVVMVVLFAALIGWEYWAVGGDRAKLVADLPIIGGLALPALAIILVNWLFVRWRVRPPAASNRGGQAI